MNNIYLIGYMGTGKTTLGHSLSKRLGTRLIDMDARIEEEQSKTISEIFAKQGEEAFRNLETDLLRRLSKQTDLIVSCGGGVPLREENATLMKTTGTVIWLDATPQTIYDRIRKDTTRPLLKDHMTPDYITTMMTQRRPSYQRAATHRIIVDDLTADEIATRIVELL